MGQENESPAERAERHKILSRILDRDREDLKPSVELFYRWLYSRSKHPSTMLFKYPNLVGKWMLFIPENEVDEVWEIVKEANVLGLLGGICKVATACPSQWGTETRLICCYTYNYKDKEDVFRVRYEMAGLGFTDVLYYKPDHMTHSGKYGESAWIYKE